VIECFSGTDSPSRPRQRAIKWVVVVAGHIEHLSLF